MVAGGSCAPCRRLTLKVAYAVTEMSRERLKAATAERLNNVKQRVRPRRQQPEEVRIAAAAGTRLAEG